MTKQVQRRRGTATQHTSFTGAEGELSVNTTNKSVHVHDNVTAGGFEAARADMDNVTSSSILTAAGITATTAELNYVDGVTSNIQTQLDGKAGTASPTFTGTLTTANLTATGTTTLAGASTSADITFGDNDKAIFGAGSDLQIYSDGTNGYIEEAGGGNLRIITNGPSVAINKGTVGGENMAVFNADGAVQLFYDNSQKIATTSTGIDVTGTVTADGLETLHTSGDVGYRLGYNSGSSAYIHRDSATGHYLLQSDETGSSWKIETDNGAGPVTRAEFDRYGDISFYEDTGTTPKFYWDASAESLGIGTSSPSAELHIEKSSADAAVRLVRTGYGYTELIGSTGGSGNDFKINLNGTDRFYIQNSSGNVGIGTSSPAAALHVDNGAGTRLFVGTANNIYYDGYDHIFRTPSGASTSMTIANSGNVGIGTSSPLYNLDVGSGSGSNSINIFSGSTDTSSLYFTDSTTGTGSYIGRLGYNHTADAMLFTTNASERMRIDSSGNVGIGTSSPDNNSGYTALTMSNTSGSGGGQVYVKASSAVGVFGADNASSGANAKVILQANTSHPLVFGTSGTERMRIDSSGNLLVGKTSADNGATVGVELRGDISKLYVTDSASSPLIANRLASDGNIAVFQKDGTTVGSIGTNSATLYIQGGGADSGLLFGGSNIYPWDSGALSDNHVTLGASGNRFKDLYLSGNAYADNFIGTNDTNTFIAMTGGDVIRHFTGGSEAMRLDASGHLLVGTTDNAVWNDTSGTGGINLRSDGILAAARNGGEPLLLNRLGTDGELIKFNKNGTTVGSIDASSGGINLSSSSLNMATNSNFFPTVDDGRDLGGVSARWDDVYATNGTIQTSDRNEKQDIAELSDAEQRVAVAAKGLMRKFRWRDAVEAKGDEARQHFGIIAQDLQAAFAAEGLDAGDYAMFISSTWTDEETGEERTRMGVRYSELLAFIIAAI